MAISARASRALHQVLGEDAGEDLVSWMQQVDSGRSEQRELHEVFEARMDARFAGFREVLHADMHELKDEVRSEITAMRSELTGMRLELAARLAESDVRMERRYVGLLRWSFVFWCGAIGAVAALAKVLR